MLNADVGSPECVSESPLSCKDFAGLGLGPRAFKVGSLSRTLLRKELEDALARGSHCFSSELLLIWGSCLRLTLKLPCSFAHPWPWALLTQTLIMTHWLDSTVWSQSCFISMALCGYMDSQPKLMPSLNFLLLPHSVTVELSPCCPVSANCFIMLGSPLPFPYGSAGHCFSLTGRFISSSLGIALCNDCLKKEKQLNCLKSLKKEKRWIGSSCGVRYSHTIYLTTNILVIIIFPADAYSWAYFEKLCSGCVLGCMKCVAPITNIAINK